MTGGGSEQTGKSWKVLLVEDSEETRLGMENLLRLYGFETVAVADPRCAFAQLEMEHFDAVITDLMLPGSNGLEVARFARKLNPSPLIVLVTCNHQANLDGALERGLIDFWFKKPLEVKKIAKALRSTLEAHALPASPRH